MLTSSFAAAVGGSMFAAEKKDVIDDTVAEFFRPFENEAATLAPDGRHVALLENRRGQPPAITIIKLEERTSQRYIVAEGAQHAVQQMLWVSPTRLIFTTRARAVGVVDLGSGEIKPLLFGRDLDTFRPEPMLSARTHAAPATPDMPADPTRVGPAETQEPRQMTVREALAQASVRGDAFADETKGGDGRALHPFLLGAKPGSPNTVLLEVRTDADLYSAQRAKRTQLTVPAGVILVERRDMLPPSDLNIVDTRPTDYGSYSVDYVPPPLVVLELDTMKGKTRELAQEEEWRRVWLDHQGRLRLALEQHGLEYRYLYRAADAKKWVPLDSLVKMPEPLGFTVTARNLLGPRSIPLGFDTEGRHVIVASNVGRNTYALRMLDPARGQLEEFEVGHDRYDLVEPTALTADGVLCFDPRTHKLAGVRFMSARRHTHWFDPVMAGLQAELNKQLAPRRCEIREWDEKKTRFLVEATAPGDPGAFLVVDAAAGKIIRCGERAPWLTEAKRNHTHEFDFVAEDGRRIAGFLTLPRKPRLNPPPVLVYFHDGPWFSDLPTFNRGAQALAALGFAVLQLNHRGSSGLGRAHLTATAGGLDQAALADVRAVLARGADGKLPLNVRMAAAFGNGIGGYLAVRMAQLAPETFRCAVAINAPGDLEAWRPSAEAVPSLFDNLRREFFGKDRAALRAQSALAAAPTTKAPVLVVQASEDAYVPASMGHGLYRALKRGSEDTAYLELRGEGHAGWSDATTAKLFAELGRFFNATIYNYGVDVRKPEIVH